MLEEKVKQYAYVMMFLNLSLALINISGIMPIHTEIAGFDVMDDMTQNAYEIQEKFSSSSGFEYVIAVGLLIYNGVKIILEFVFLVFAGLVPVFQAFGISALIYGPIVTVIDAIVLYDLGKMLLRIG